MQILRYVLRNITPLNVILLIALAVLAGAIYPTLTRRGSFDLPTAGSKAPPEKEPTSFASLPDLSDYTVVGELNIFHPDRKPPPPIEEEPETMEPLPSADFTLYGTLVSDDVTLAFVEERSTSRRRTGGRKRISILRVGDTLAGYTLKSIEEDKIVMVRGEEEVTVPLDNPAAGRERELRQRQPQRKRPATRGRTGR